jgi:hypothetical protein
MMGFSVIGLRFILAWDWSLIRREILPSQTVWESIRRELLFE